MTAKKMLHGREFKISCGRFDRKISVEVDGKPAEKVDGALFRVALADGKYLQFRVEGSYMTGMNLIEGNVTLVVSGFLERKYAVGGFQAYKLVRISVHLRTAAVFGLRRGFRA